MSPVLHSRPIRHPPALDDPDTDHADLDDALRRTRPPARPLHVAPADERRRPPDGDPDAFRSSFGNLPSEFVWDSAGPSAVHTHVTRPIVVQLDRFGARTVLDVGCGNGWFAAGLARCGFDSMGVDSSESGVDIARRTFPEVAYRRVDAMLPLPPSLVGRFDAVVAIDVLDHVMLPRELIRQVATALRPGGLFVATMPYHSYLKNLGIALSARFDERWHTLRDHGRLKFYSRRTALALLADCGLERLHFETIGRIPPIARSMLVAGTMADGSPPTGGRS